VLTKLRFYGDDGQVSTLIVSKSWGDRVGISVGREAIQTF
jgi:Holliday junction resolvase RusA-like endonuclease